MKTVLITGCATGFGRDLVERFLSNGDKVIATMRKLEERESQFSGLKENYHDRLILKELDITDPSQRKEVLSSIDSLDILVNNAGYALYGALEDMSEEQIRLQMEVNFMGTTLMIQTFYQNCENPKEKLSISPRCFAAPECH